MTASAARRWNLWGGVITALTVAGAVLWAFPLYWGVVSSLKPDDEVVRLGLQSTMPAPARQPASGRVACSSPAVAKARPGQPLFRSPVVQPGAAEWERRRR